MNFFKKDGLLKVVVAKGVISTYEINELSNKQQIVFTDRESGTPCSLYFNDRLLAYCEVVIIDRQYAVRIEECKNWKPEPVLDKLLLDDREILNSELVLGEREVTTEEILNLTRGSIIPINTLHSFNRENPTLGKLYVSGIEVANGHICSVDGYWTLEITEVNHKKEDDIPRRDSYLKSSDRCKYYDFSRPEVVTKSNLDRFIRVHKFFGNYINATVDHINHMTFGDLKERFNNHKLLLIEKEARKVITATGNKRYFLPLDGDDESNQKTEEYCKEYALKRLNNQVMEKIGIVYNNNKIEEYLLENFPQVKSYLETSWRDQVNLTMGYMSDTIINVSKSTFVHDYELLVVVKMYLEGEELLITYPLSYFIQILNELK